MTLLLSHKPIVWLLQPERPFILAAAEVISGCSHWHADVSHNHDCAARRRTP